MEVQGHVRKAVIAHLSLVVAVFESHNIVYNDVNRVWFSIAYRTTLLQDHQEKLERVVLWQRGLSIFKRRALS